MKILAIDTSSSICSVALLEDNKLIDEINIDDGKTHSENLMPILDEIVKKNCKDIHDIDLIACTVGPGSFTGIRIGVASIKPIAEVLNIKVAEVTSLENLACNSTSSLICSLIDARNNQVYCGLFDNNYDKKEEFLADDINVILESLKNYENVTFVGNGSILHKELIESKMKNSNFCDKNTQSAYNTGLIGYKKYLANDLKNADTIMPIYLRKSQAERLKK